MQTRKIDEIEFVSEPSCEVNVYLYEVKHKNMEKRQQKEWIIAINYEEAIEKFKEKKEKILDQNEIEKIYKIEQKKKLGTIKDTYGLEVYKMIKSETKFDKVLFYYRDNVDKRMEIFESINNTIKSGIIKNKENTLKKMLDKEELEIYKKRDTYEW